MSSREDSAPSVSSDVSSAPAEGINALITRILEQLSLSAWLPAAFFTSSMALLQRFQANGRVDVGQAIRDITENPAGFLVLLTPLLVVATMVTQAFSFTAIRTLEGYWRGWGPAGAFRSTLIKLQLRRKSSLHRRRLSANSRAFAAARPKMLKHLSHPIVNYLEAMALEIDPPAVDDEADRDQLKYLQWRTHCDPWRLAKIDSLIREEKRYPQSRRVMPTKLGNVLRAAEDSLETHREDLQGWVIRRKDLVPLRLRLDHDHFRTRLDMYAILVFVAAFMAVVTPVALVGRVEDAWSITIVTAVFTGIGLASYQAAIASAEGYGQILQEMNRRVGAP